jgi:Hemerythrin HHE cation binding domain
MALLQANRFTRATMSAVLTLLIAGLPAGLAAQERQVTRDFAIPMTLVEEHAEFHTALEHATRIAGPLGDAAQDVLALLNPHLAKEERYALASLKLLPAVARGQVTPDMVEWLPASDGLRAELDTLVREHRAIAKALDQLARTAWAEGQPEFAFLATRILRHARMEEEVLYPAALLVGEYLRLRLPPLSTANAQPSESIPLPRP